MRALRVSVLLLAGLLGGCGSLPGLPGSAPTDRTDAASMAPPQVSARAQLRFSSANTAIERGDLAAARPDLEWLTVNFPELSGPYLNLALIEQDLGNTAQAEAHFVAALAANPGNLAASNQYAIFLRRQGRFEASESIYLDALVIAPDHAETHRNLGVLYDLYRGNAAQALKHYYRYQALTVEEDRVVAGWIIDLERRYAGLVQQETP